MLFANSAIFVSGTYNELNPNLPSWLVKYMYDVYKNIKFPH